MSAKKKKKMSKVKKHKDLTQVHGMAEPVGEYQPSTLDQILGDTGLAKYKTLNENEYLSSIDNMLKTELRSHAISVGLLPIDNFEMLKSRLLREFRKYACKYKRPLENQNEKNFNLSEEAKRILAEGK